MKLTKDTSTLVLQFVCARVQRARVSLLPRQMTVGEQESTAPGVPSRPEFLSALTSCTWFKLCLGSDRTKHSGKDPAMGGIKRVPVNKTAQARGIENRGLADI